MRAYKKWILCSWIAVFILGSCSSPGNIPIAEENEYTQLQLNQQPINISEAVEIVLDWNPKEKTDLLMEVFSIDDGETDAEAGTYFEILECTKNQKDTFYTKCYSEIMAQFSYFNQVYQYNAEQDQSILLYETADAIWVNELVAADNTVYWVEYNKYENGKSGIMYRVMQFNLGTGEVQCIASRDSDEAGELCLAISEQYVTWYDFYRDDKKAIISIYDIKNQEIISIEDGVQLFAPYERLDVVDGAITYFTEDEEENLYINRYDISSTKKDILWLGEKKDYKKLSGCFSDSEYIGWFEEYGWGPYYFYNMESGVLYCLHPPKGMSVFSQWVSEGCLYVNESLDDRIYVYDFVSGDVLYQNLPPDSTGFVICQYEDGAPYLKVRMGDETKLLSIEIQ